MVFIVLSLRAYCKCIRVAVSYRPAQSTVCTKTIYCTAKIEKCIMHTNKNGERSRESVSLCKKNTHYLTFYSVCMYVNNIDMEMELDALWMHTALHCTAPHLWSARGTHLCAFLTVVLRCTTVLHRMLQPVRGEMVIIMHTRSHAHAREIAFEHAL